MMMKNETWLYNTTRFIGYTSWIYDRSVKEFYTQAKAKCLEKSKAIKFFYKYPKK
jgi:hypothetical protein